ncbi:hypothetical protein IU433_14240 [Nocardia puris]|uniref:hypothetical protein n=1 Tax=Nocardia puris TaxID=208602 RepID=UPI00189441C4|nr:hypothetical protein [Nocardia puris]MBF6460197.1 hypothetical protein [Nocardia puris]
MTNRVYLTKIASDCVPHALAFHDDSAEGLAYIKAERVISKENGWLRVRPIAPHDNELVDLPPTSVAAVVIDKGADEEESQEKMN